MATVLPVIVARGPRTPRAAHLPKALATLPYVAGTRSRSVVGVVARVLAGLVVAVLLAAAVLVILAYYGDLSFDVEAVVIAILAAAILVFLWTRWR